MNDPGELSWRGVRTEPSDAMTNSLDLMLVNRESILWGNFIFSWDRRV